MKKFLFLSVLLMATISCRALYLSEMTPSSKYGERLLPPLKTYLDIESFETVFSSSNTYTTAQATHNIGVGGPYTNYYSTSSTYKNPQINDLKVIFQNDVQNNICSKYGTTKGSIVCSIVSGSHGRRIGLWPLGAAVMLGVPYLFGMPTGASKTYLKLRVDIYDNSNNLVGSYESPMLKEKKYMALYWGYNGSNAESKTSWDTFKGCMDNIKQQIANDYDRLNSALE